MNSKVRRYQPLYLPPSSPTHKPRLAPASPRKWKQLLNKQVDDYYSKLKSANDKSGIGPKTAKSANKVQPLLDNSSSKSEIRSIYTNWSGSTPKKSVNLSVWKYDSMSTSVNDAQFKKQTEKDNYRIKLLEQQCNYLRSQFIQHCRHKHPKEFGL